MNDGQEAELAEPANGNDDLWQVYILRCTDGTLYTGIAKDLDRRLGEHNAGQGARYTRSRLPVELVYEEEAADRGSALRREHEIRQLDTAAKRELVSGGRLQSGRRNG